MEDRKAAEAEFHNSLRKNFSDQIWTPEADARFEADPMWSNMKYYSVERKNRDYVTESLKKYCAGGDVLDYCCGNGLDTVRIAKDMHPKSVIGVDISDVSIENSRVRARSEGVDGVAKFAVMDAEELTFPDNSFDVIHVYGVLHHLNLDKAYAQLSRVLRPGGHVIATEAMKHNPAIALYRRRTPHLRTEWEAEHILGRGEIRQAYKYFDGIDVRLFNLATLAAVPLRRRKVFGPVLRVLEAVDSLLLEVPGLKWWAWMSVFTLSKPRKKTNGG